MIEDAATTTTTTDPTMSSLVPDTESEILNAIPPSMALKEVDTTKMSFKKKLLLRKALSKAAGSSESSSVDDSSIENSAVDVDSSSSDDAAAVAADDVDSETYNKSNQPKAFRQSTGHSSPCPIL